MIMEMKEKSYTLLKIFLALQFAPPVLPCIPPGNKWPIHKMSKEIAFFCSHFQLPLRTKIQPSAKEETSCDKVRQDR